MTYFLFSSNLADIEFVQCGQVACFNIIYLSIDRFSISIMMNIQRVMFILHYNLYTFHRDYILDWMPLD